MTPWAVRRTRPTTTTARSPTARRARWPTAPRLAVYVVRRRRGLPLRRRPHRGPAARRARTRPGQHRVARLRQPRRRVPAARPAGGVSASRRPSCSTPTSTTRRPRCSPRPAGVGAEIVGHGRSNSDSLSGMTAADERAYLAAVADRIAAEEGTRAGRLVEPVAHPHPSDARPAGRDRLPLSARPAPGRPAGLAEHRRPGRCSRSRTRWSSTTAPRSSAASASAREFADMIVDEFDELLIAAARTSRWS